MPRKTNGVNFGKISLYGENVGMDDLIDKLGRILEDYGYPEDESYELNVDKEADEDDDPEEEAVEETSDEAEETQEDSEDDKEEDEGMDSPWLKKAREMDEEGLDEQKLKDLEDPLEDG